MQGRLPPSIGYATKMPRMVGKGLTITPNLTSMGGRTPA